MGRKEKEKERRGKKGNGGEYTDLLILEKNITQTPYFSTRSKISSRTSAEKSERIILYSLKEIIPWDCEREKKGKRG